MKIQKRVTKSKRLTPRGRIKMGKVMKEFKSKTLKSGKGGRVVKNIKQAVAIGYSEARTVQRRVKSAIK